MPSCNQVLTTIALVVGLIVAMPVSGAAKPLMRTSQPASSSAQRIAPRSIELNEKGFTVAQTGDLSHARSLFQEALNVDDRNVSAALNLSIVLVTLGDLKQPITLLSRYAERYPGEVSLMVRLGDTFFADKQVSQALSWYERAYALEPGRLNLAAKLATIYSLQGKLVQAEKMLAVAAELSPNNAETLANLASLYLANEKLDLAIPAAKKSIQIQAGISAYITLGEAYEAKGDVENAIIALRSAQNLGDSRKELSDKIAALVERQAKRSSQKAVGY